MIPESVFDLEVGDRVRHGRNYGTVTGEGSCGPTIQWDHGLIDYCYTEELYKAHPLYKVTDAEPSDPPAVLDSWPTRDELGRLTNA